MTKVSFFVLLIFWVCGCDNHRREGFKSMLQSVIEDNNTYHLDMISHHIHLLELEIIESDYMPLDFNDTNNVYWKRQQEFLLKEKETLLNMKKFHSDFINAVQNDQLAEAYDLLSKFQDEYTFEDHLSYKNDKLKKVSAYVHNTNAHNRQFTKQELINIAAKTIKSMVMSLLPINCYVKWDYILSDNSNSLPFKHKDLNTIVFLKEGKKKHPNLITPKGFLVSFENRYIQTNGAQLLDKYLKRKDKDIIDQIDIGKKELNFLKINFPVNKSGRYVLYHKYTYSKKADTILGIKNVWYLKLN